jgi:4'-phosphopantetheinyl transferase
LPQHGEDWALAGAVLRAFLRGFALSMSNDPPFQDAVAVDIWTWSLDRAFDDEREARDLLSEDERVRGERFLRVVDRRRHVFGRAGLRLVLAGYLNRPAQTIRFSYNAWGKPGLILEDGESLQFNLSHSAGEAVLAVSPDAEMGVDIEEVRAIEEDVARHFFSAAEYAELAALPVHERANAFYRCWTRKEAFVKAHGAGLSVPLDSFDVSIHKTSGKDLMRRLDPNIGLLSDWGLVNLDVMHGFCGALAVHSGGLDVKVCYRNRLAWSANMASMM